MCKTLSWWEPQGSGKPALLPRKEHGEWPPSRHRLSPRHTPPTCAHYIKSSLPCPKEGNKWLTVSNLAEVLPLGSQPPNSSLVSLILRELPCRKSKGLWPKAVSRKTVLLYLSSYGLQSSTISSQKLLHKDSKNLISSPSNTQIS